ncbi:MAG: TIGR02996 domain-containing protein [Archangium sp.]|nr:TIGR02996 domain-containing protein [Archangium sp.]
MSDDAAALRAAIFSNPADDRLRSVYADFLQERGDRYGLFIAAQLRRDARTALAELGAAIHATTLPLFRDTDALPKHAGLGAIGKPALRCFDRGFLRACEVSANATSHLSADAWPLVEWLAVTAPDSEALISAIAPRLTSLHSFSCAQGATARALAALRPQRLRRLKVADLGQGFSLDPLVDELTALDLTYSALRIQRTPGRVQLELRRPRTAQELERLVRALVPTRAPVELTWTTRGDPHPLLEVCRRTLDELECEVEEMPMYVVG